MGLSNKKSKTTETSSSTTNAVATKTNPQFVTDALTKFTGGVTDLMGRNPTDFVAPANSLQTQAGTAAGNLGGYQSGLTAAGDLASRAAGMTTPQVKGSSLLDNLDAYMNPNISKVVDTTLADMDVDQGRTRAAQAASGALNTAFGGSRFGVREAQTEGELTRARATADAQLRSNAFDTGAALAGQDADRRQQADLANQGAYAGDASRLISAGGLMGNLAEASGNGARSDIATQLATGDTLRGIDTETRQAPLGLMSAIGDLLNQGQFGLFNGSNVTTTGTGTGTTSGSSDPGLLGALSAIIGLGTGGIDFASKVKNF